MTEQQFAYWLQGFAELNPNAPTQEQWQSIRDHLATVFQKVTPPVTLTPASGEYRRVRGYEKLFQQPSPYPAVSDKIIY